jgi:hypothetical protein
METTKDFTHVIRSISLAIGIAVGIAGCGTTPVSKVRMLNSFDAAEAKSLLASGKNSIHGSALMRQVGGGVVSCAGTQVRLIPATAYAQERMVFIYQSGTAGTKSAMQLQLNPDPFEATDPKYFEMQKVAICDAQGVFKFNDVADGDFFIITQITWKANPSSSFFEGGTMMRRVQVRDGERRELVIAP